MHSIVHFYGLLILLRPRLVVDPFCRTSGFEFTLFRRTKELPRVIHPLCLVCFNFFGNSCFPLWLRSPNYLWLWLVCIGLRWVTLRPNTLLWPLCPYHLWLCVLFLLNRSLTPLRVLLILTFAHHHFYQLLLFALCSTYIFMLVLTRFLIWTSSFVIFIFLSIFTNLLF